MVTAKKIAEIAEVSRSTVQRALSNHPNISDETKQKIMKIADKLGYKPSKTARALVMHQQSIRYGVVMTSEAHPFYKEVLKGINQAIEDLQEYGLHVDVRFMKEITASAQIELIDEMVAEGCRGILLTPIDDDDVKAAVKRGRDKDVIFITFVSDLEDIDRSCFIGQDHYKSGCVAAGLMKYITNPFDKIVCIIGSMQFTAHRERLDGFRTRFLEERSEADIVEVVENEDSSIISEKIVHRLLSEYPDLKGIFIIGSGVKGVCEALEFHGKASELKLICYDITPASLKYCEERVIDFLIDQDSFQEGYKALQILNEYIMFNENPQPVVYSKIDIRTRDNIGS
jgi:LacI family transcriptional regulator